MKIQNLKKIWNVSIYETKILLFSPKFLLLSAMSLIIMDMSIQSIRQFALNYHLQMPPAILPFYFSDIIFGNIMYLFLIFLFSDIPLKQKGQNQILQRCGLGCFGMGQLFSIVLVSVVFVLEQLLFSIVVCAPCLTFGGWGKTWGAVADNVFLEAGYTTSLGVSADVLRDYTVAEAVGLCMASFLLTGISYGLIIFLLNGISKGRAGTAVMSFWSVVWFFLNNNENPVIRKLMKFAPQHFNDLSLREKGDFTELLFIFGGNIFIFIIVNMILIRKRKLLLVK